MLVPHPEDLAWVRKFRKRLASEIPTVCRFVQEELGRGSFETLTADIVPLLSACVWTERHARRLLRARSVPGKSIWQLGQRHRVIRVPLGHVGIIATWNYPVQLLGIQLMHAIAAGNRVTVKPSERTPRTQGFLLQVARDAGLPESRLNWTRSDRDAGEAMLRDLRFDHVVFTGSTKTGRQIAECLAKSLTPSTLELSGCDSAIVMDEADLRLAARSIGFAVMLNAGQTCMAPRRVLLPAHRAEPFVAELCKFLSNSRLSTSIDTPAATAAARAVLAAEKEGATRRFGDAGAGQWPVVVSDCTPTCDLVRQEHFAPVLAIVPTDSDEESFQIHAQISQRLATSVFVGTRGDESAIAARLGSTVVTFNDCVIPTGHPGVSIGGIGASGWGLSRGAVGLLSMTRPVFVARTSARIRTPLDPPTKKVAAKAESFVRWWYS